MQGDFQRMCYKRGVVCRSYTSPLEVILLPLIYDMKWLNGCSVWLHVYIICKEWNVGLRITLYGVWGFTPCICSPGSKTIKVWVEV